MTRRLGMAALVTALATLFIVTGARGVDLGEHWDEVEWHIQPVQKMVATGTFLPHAYIYPSLSKWLVLLPSLPGALKAGLATGFDPPSVQNAMRSVVDAPDFLLRARLVFIVMSGLVIFWIYGAARALERPPWEAFIAACCVGLSWEYAYHARWVANDCILTQFVALTLFLLALFKRTRRPLWLTLAAIATGLGTGAKSPGVLMLGPILLAGVASRPREDLLRQAARVVALCAVAFAAFLVTTPGTLLEPFIFLRDSHTISAAYQGTHDGYTILTAWGHWRLVLTYLAVSYFSPFLGVSVAVFVSALAGAVLWARADRRTAALLIGFPLLFLLFFCRYHIAIMRNYILLTPFLALLAARGIGAAFEQVPGPWPRRACGAALGVLAVVQGAWLVRAGEGIRHHDLHTYAREALAYVADHPGRTFRVSDRVRALAAEQQLALPGNVVAAPDGGAVVFLARADNVPPRQRRTNDPWLMQEVFGPREVNLNWYSTWEGRDRVLVMSLDKAREARIPLAR